MKLTDEQIAELAPEWATHYRESITAVVFESVRRYQVFAGGVFSQRYPQYCVSEDAKPLPKKKFDITEHEFSDIYKDAEKVDPSILDVKFWLADREDLTLNKKDAIALAKHFKLTEDDLK
jgi:hypothetical protein